MEETLMSRVDVQALKSTHLEEEKPLLNEENIPSIADGPRRNGCFSSHSHRKPFIILNVLAVLFHIVVVVYWTTHIQDDKSCLGRFNSYSPALDAVEYKTVIFNATLEQPSIYRGTPRPELEEAWDRLTRTGVFPITEHDLDILGKSSTDSLKIPPEQGGGYAAQLEVTHQLHCLRFLREYTYLDHYVHTSPSFQNQPDWQIRTHVDHCLEILRIKLMCDGDVSMLTFHQPENYDHPTPDFNTMHRCRNFERIGDWAEKHQVWVKDLVL